MTKIILVVLVIAATLTECIVMRKSREYDAADNIAGLLFSYPKLPPARRKRSGAAAERGLAREKGRGRRKEKLWHLNG